MEFPHDTIEPLEKWQNTIIKGATTINGSNVDFCY